MPPDSSSRGAPGASLFGVVEPYGGDPILSLSEMFQADPRPDKVNLGIGVYQNEDGMIPVLGSVKAAREKLGFGPSPYLPMEGSQGLREAIQHLVFGRNHPAVATRRIATIQTVGGTGALAIAADFLARHCPARTVYVSDPSWENHHGLFHRAGFETTTYPYLDRETSVIAFDRMLATLDLASPGSIVIVQPVCHNPTGLDLSRDQQDELGGLMLRKGHVAMFDMAYQGLGVGLAEDAEFVRCYAERASCLVANSFSKNFSLYGERSGGLSIVCRDGNEAERALGQLKLAVRRTYSSPPSTGGLLVAEILNDPGLKAQWEAELASMRDRLRAMRTGLLARLAAQPGNPVAHLLANQRGMFGLTGLSSEQVRIMRARDAIYLLPNGRLCLAGLNAGNLESVANSIFRVADPPDDAISSAPMSG